MVSRTSLTPLDKTPERPPKSGGGQSRQSSRRVQRITRRLSLGVVLACAVFFLFPVIAHPITGDDRYWYLWMGSAADWSLIDEIRRMAGVLEARMSYGRLNVLTEVERRLGAKSLIEPAVATGTPVTAYLALQKLLLAAAGVLTVLAMLRSLRWRGADGRLVRIGRRTLILAAAAGTLALAVGAQAYSTGVNGWNGWTAYPVSTYGAVISIFGTVALLLWLTRLVAERSRRTLIIAVTVLAALAVATNFRYELVFPALPIAALALLVVPVADRARRFAGRRAKVITGAAFFGAFTPVFVATRLYLDRRCEQQECYDGIQVVLGMPAVRTSTYNILSTIPGSGGTELATFLEKAGWPDRYPVPPTAWSVLGGLLAVGALLLLWWATRKVGLGIGAVDGLPPARRAGRRAEAVLLAIGAGIALLTALGTAVIMGLSPHAHELVASPGTLYRNAMVTWTGLAFCGVLAVLALGRILAPRGAFLTWTVLALVIGTIGALSLPGNMMALRASRVLYSVSETVNWEVVKGDLQPGADARRCELFERAEEAVGGSGSRRRFYHHANAAFERYYDRPFCSDLSYQRWPK